MSFSFRKSYNNKADIALLIPVTQTISYILSSKKKYMSHNLHKYTCSCMVDNFQILVRDWSHKRFRVILKAYGTVMPKIKCNKIMFMKIKGT